jgi:hypothetical protein
MPELEKLITEWRQQMLAAGIKTPVPLEELESHLRDDIEQQMGAGVGAQAAFNEAVQRLGRADLLKSMFDPSHSDVRFLRPVYLRLFCFLASPLLLLASIWATAGAEASQVQRTLGLGTISLIALYVAGLPFVYRRLFTRHDRVMQVAMRVAYWLVLAWPLLALLSAFGIVQLGIGVEMALWSAFGGIFASWLAWATHGQEIAARAAIAEGS